MLSDSIGSQPNALSLLPVWRPSDALLAALDRNRGSELVQLLPYGSSPQQQDAPGGLPGMMARAGLLDPQYPDDPPVAGLRRLIQDWMRNNPDGGSAA
jgi:hypothetical protein